MNDQELESLLGYSLDDAQFGRVYNLERGRAERFGLGMLEPGDELGLPEYTDKRTEEAD